MALVPLIHMLFTLYTLALIFRSFLPLVGIDPYHPVARFLFQITEPLLAPIRARIPPRGMVDWSPMVAIILLWVLEMILVSFLP